MSILESAPKACNVIARGGTPGEKCSWIAKALKARYDSVTITRFSKSRCAKHAALSALETDGARVPGAALRLPLALTSRAFGAHAPEPTLSAYCESLGYFLPAASPTIDDNISIHE